MPYREDLEAAHALAEATRRELEAARAENAADHARIAALEKQLAEVSAPPVWWQVAMWVTFAILAVVGIAGLLGLYER